LRCHFTGAAGVIDERTARRLEGLRFIKPKSQQMNLDRVNQVLSYVSAGDDYGSIFNHETIADFVACWVPMVKAARVLECDSAYQEAWLSLRYSTRPEKLDCLEYARQEILGRIDLARTLHPEMSGPGFLLSQEVLCTDDGAASAIALFSILSDLEFKDQCFGEIAGAIRQARSPLLRDLLLREPATFVQLRRSFPLADWAGLSRSECRDLEDRFLAQVHADRWQLVLGKLAGCQFDLT
jgi:hypothetical protein